MPFMNQATPQYRTWRWLSAGTAAAALAVACSSSPTGAPVSPVTPVNDAGPTAQPATEVARKDVGPEGGRVEGGGTTIDIPAGALDASTTIVIKELDPTTVTLPATTKLAGKVYSFEPDDITFLKPVSITIAWDTTKKLPDGKGAVLLLRSPKGQNQWKPRGAAETSGTDVKATTTHFSDWAATVADGGNCFAIAGCWVDAGPTGVGPLDCKIPATGGGLHCAGQGTYTCTCDGSPDVIATLPVTAQGTPNPTPELMSALAASCGTTCEPAKDAGPPSDSAPENPGYALRCAIPALARESSPSQPNNVACAGCSLYGCALGSAPVCTPSHASGPGEDLNCDQPATCTCQSGATATPDNASSCKPTYSLGGDVTVPIAAWKSTCNGCSISCTNGLQAVCTNAIVTYTASSMSYACTQQPTCACQ